MKSSTALIVMLLALSTMLVAATKNVSTTVKLSSEVTVNGSALPAGECKVSWAAPGDKTDVTLACGKTTVVVPAKIVSQKNSQDVVLTRRDGTAKVLTGLQLRSANVTFEPTETAGK